MNFDCPIVLIIYRRPDLTSKVFEAIRKLRPKELFVIADGPRSIEESILCEEARQITENIDWECKVLRNYSDVNLSSRVRVKNGIDWVFEHVSEAIILEDDCLPDISFFEYCKVLLEHYKEDERIWCISGNNFQDGIQRGNGSYYFSNYPHCWGWATWRRAWQFYDVGLSNWPVFKKNQSLLEILDSQQEVGYWHKIFEQLYNSNDPPNWDYGWTFTCWQHSALTVLPNHNLVSNLGFRSDATNTRNPSKYANMAVDEIDVIRHPEYIVRDRLADMYTFDHHFNGLYQRRIDMKIKKKIFDFFNVKKYS